MANRLTFPVLACVLLAANVAAPQDTRLEWRVGQGPGVQPQSTRSEAELKAEIAAEPASIRAYMELAQRYRSENRIEDAEAVVRSAIPHAANSDPLFGMLTSLYSPMYNPEKVLEISEEWARAAPGVRPLTMIATAHLELAKRLRASSLQQAVTHLDDATRALDDARAMEPDSPGLLPVRTNMLRTRAEFETDPARRAALMREANDVMRRMQSRSTGTMASPPPPSPPPPGSAFAPGVGPLRVGGGIRQPIKLKDVRPVYPPDARDAHVQGVVILEVVIGGSGAVTDARVLRSIPLLDQAAIDAVRQWEFQPTLLNGVAVPVIMVATVNFSLE